MVKTEKRRRGSFSLCGYQRKDGDNRCNAVSLSHGPVPSEERFNIQAPPVYSSCLPKHIKELEAGFAMDKELLQASQTGNVEYLHLLIRDYPSVLNKFALFSTENPLHIASAAGHVGFVKEVIRLKPELAKEMDLDGFSPMHMAAANGYVEIVEELLKVDPSLCRLEGNGKRTPLHCAAIKGRTEVINSMLLASPDCIADVNIQKETALHLAAKNNQFEAVKLLVGWIIELDKADRFNVKDERGNTILHLATWRKQRQVIELLLCQGTSSSDLVDVNARNDSGLTALDVLLMFPSEAGDREMAEILLGAGAKRGNDINITPSPGSLFHSTVYIPSASETPQTGDSNCVEYFKFKKDRDSPSEARSILLVIAVLVATATFQAGVSPPGGIWQEDALTDAKNSTISTSKTHYAGESIMGSSASIAFSLFVFFNSVGFTTSLLMINILTTRFPLRFELQICILAMYFTYNAAITQIAPDTARIYVIVITYVLFVITLPLAKWIRINIKTVGDYVMSIVHRII